MIAEPSYYVGRPVESMQTMLRFAAEGNNRLLPVVPDGVFGPNTMAAVTAFQRYYGLPATGVMNGATWERLVQTYQAQLVQQAPAEAMQPILNPQQTMKPGESNYHIYLVQAALRVLSSVYRGLPQTPVSGTLDASTVTAVRRFQALCGLPVDFPLHGLPLRSGAQKGQAEGKSCLLEPPGQSDGSERMLPGKEAACPQERASRWVLLRQEGSFAVKVDLGKIAEAVGLAWVAPGPGGV